MLVVLFLCNDVDRNNIKIGGYLLRKKIFIIIMVLLLSSGRIKNVQVKAFAKSAYVI